MTSAAPIVQPDDAEPEQQAKPVSRWRMRLHHLSILFTSFTLCLLALRCLFRDRWIGVEVFFWVPFWVFALPTVFFCFGLLGWRLKGIGLSVVAVLSIATLALEQPLLMSRSTLNDQPVPENATSLLVWNVMMYNRGKRNVIEGYEQPSADLNMLLEGTYKGEVPTFLKAELSSSYTWVSTKQMAVGSKLKVLGSEEVKTATALRVFKTTLELPSGKPLILLLVDFPSPPRLGSAELFLELEQLLSQYKGQNVVIAGDFNTPRGSYWLRRVFRDFQDAYLSAMQRPGGWIASFPNQFPLVQIDHCFASPEITLHRAELLAGDASDHYRQYIVFSVEENQLPTPQLSPTPTGNTKGKTP